MPVTIRKLHPLFVGEVTGVDLTKPVSLDDAAAMPDAPLARAKLSKLQLRRQARA